MPTASWNVRAWRSIDTVLLDMDGTLLDLNYDNRVWSELLPNAYAARHTLSLDESRRVLLEHMRAIHGTLDFYCFEYWADHTGIDIEALHGEATDLVRYRADAEAFLEWLASSGRRVILTTNAHRASLAVKDAHSGICSRVADVVSSHDYGAPKESAAFWERFAREHALSPESTLFIDDNEPVLAAARDFGIRFNLAVETPDSRRPPRRANAFPGFDHFREICPHIETGAGAR